MIATIIIATIMCALLMTALIISNKAESSGYGVGFPENFEVLEVNPNFNQIVYSKSTDDVYFIYYAHQNIPQMEYSLVNTIPIREPYLGPNGKPCYYKDKKIIEKETEIIVKNYTEK